MRLVIRAALVREPLALEAHASEERLSPVGRWFAANLDVKTLLAIAAVVVTLFGVHTHDEADRAELHTQLRANHERLGELTSLSHTFVTRAEIDKTDRQHDQLLSDLAVGQRDIYALLVQSGATPLRTVPRLR